MAGSPRAPPARRDPPGPFPLPGQPRSLWGLGGVEGGWWDHEGLWAVKSSVVGQEWSGASSPVSCWVTQWFTLRARG